MATRSERRRRIDADLIFNGSALSHDLLPELWRKGTEQRQFSRYRVNTARGLRRKTTVVQLNATWARRHPEAADWVVKVLPERRTLERDLIAAVAAVEPSYSRVAVGKGIQRDFTNASACENYMEEWRRANVPYQTFAEKCAEDGEHGLVVLPTDVDMEGCPDFYDRLDQRAYDALGDEARSDYEVEDEDAPRRRYVKRNPDGSKKVNPTYGEADDEQSREAHAEAMRRYLLAQEQGGVTVRVIPANDCVPYLVRGTRRDRWKLFALIERTLYYPEELLTKGYGWRGMGDRALLPQGFDATRTSGQNGMFYLYTLYWVWVDPKDPRKIKRPIVAYSVAGWPTWVDDPKPEQEAPESGVAIIDLYEQYGLEGPFWWYGGGLHTSDDNPDFYWEPYLWPLSETILSLEGKQTSINAATATGAFTGWFHKPDAALVEQDPEALVDSATQALMKPTMPEAGEIETVVGEVFPATPTTVSSDAWRAVEMDLVSLRENTALEQAGAGAQPSGRALVVKETIAQTAKRHIREGALDAVRFCGEAAMKIFTAIEREHGVKWPIQTTKERPVGTELKAASETLEWDSAWVGAGEYKLVTSYPEEYNPVKVETAMSATERGFASPEDVWEAMGKTDAESEWTKILKWRIRQQPAYIEAQVTRLAKRQGDALMLKVLKLQQQQKMTQSGPPGFEQGLPTAALNGPSSGGVNGGPTTAQRSLGGQRAAEYGPPMQDARAAAAVGSPPPEAA